MTRHVAWLVALVALSASGCATLAEQRARARIMETEVGGYRYRQPVEAVWPEVRRMLAERGLKLAGKDAEAAGQSISTLERVISVARETSETPRGGLTLETAWTYGGWRWRVVADPDQGGCRVVITRIQENPTDHGHDGLSGRDYEWELDLIRRFDPATADRIDDLLDPPGTARAARPAASPVPPAEPPPPAPPPEPPVPSIRVE